jgi:F420-dependent oxidoreductase-like protein
MIRLGYTIGTFHQVAGDQYLIDAVYREAQAAEAAGFDSLWVADHLMQTPAVAPRNDPILECYVTLAALAAVTSKVRLGAFVTCAGYRNAALLGKIVTTLDHVSRGRAVFGIGAGWFEEEHESYGYEFGTVGERFDRMVDVLDIVQSMFREEATTHEGRHFRARGALNSPPPVQPGGPPTMIGGSGEKRTLRLVAERADLCNVAGTPERVRHLMAVLDDHCAAVGRDPASVCRTYISPVVVRQTRGLAEAAAGSYYRDRTPAIIGTRAEVTAHLRSVLDAGIDGLILSCVHEDRTSDYIQLLADIVADARS